MSQSERIELTIDSVVPIDLRVPQREPAIEEQLEPLRALVCNASNLSATQKDALLGVLVPEKTARIERRMNFGADTTNVIEFQATWPE